MVNWQLLAIIGFSVAGGLLLALLLAICVCIRCRRCVHRQHTAKIVQLQENLKAIERENEAKEEAVSTLRRSVADFDAEKSLLLKRLESCDKLSTPEDMRSCLRELQLHVAVQAANASSIHKAVNMDFKKGPPALLAEVWLIHGETQRVGDESSNPSLGEPHCPFSKPKGADGAYTRKHKGVHEDGPTSTGISTCMRQPPPMREFHTCATHWAVPPCGAIPQLSPCDAPETAHPMEASATFQTNTCVLSETGGARYGETTALHAATQPTEEGITRNWATTRSCGDNDSSGCPCLQESCGWVVTRAIESSSACQGAGVSTFTGDTEFSRTSNCCGATKDCCDTAVIPAHTFAPEYIFVAEQWLPGPCEAAKSSSHSIPLARLAKFSRRDQSKTASLENELYQQILPDSHKFEKVLISSKQTQNLHLVSSSRDHVKLQSRALASVLPSLDVSTKALAFPHLCYSLVEYKFEQIRSLSKHALKGYIGDTLHQPLSLVVRVFERTSMPGATPSASPTNKEDELVTDEEQDSWRFVYETAPVSVVDAGCRVTEDDTVNFGEGATFQYKHTCIPPQALLADQPARAEPGSACRACHSPVRKTNEPVAACTTQTANCHDSFADTTELVATHTARRASLLTVRTNEEINASQPTDGIPTVIIGRRACNASTLAKLSDCVRGECDEDCTPRKIGFVSGLRARAASPTCQLIGCRGLAKSSSAEEELEVHCGSPGRDCNPPGVASCEVLRSAAGRFSLSPAADGPEAASVSRFKSACLNQQGPLYEDEVLTVSCVVGTTTTPNSNALHASVELSIVNRKYAAPSPGCSTHETTLDVSNQSSVTGFHAVHTTVENVEREALSCSVTPIVRAPPSGPGSPARVCQTISATVTQPFQYVPEVSLKVVLLDGSEKRCSFALPLVIAQFMKPVELLPAAFMQLWFDGTLHPRRLSIRISNQIKTAGPRELVKVITLNGKLAVARGIKHPLADGSIFAIGELAAIGDMVGESKCLVRLWQSHHTTSSMAKLEIKAEHRRLLDAISELLTYLLQDSD